MMIDEGNREMENSGMSHNSESRNEVGCKNGSLGNDTRKRVCDKKALVQNVKGRTRVDGLWMWMIKVNGRCAKWRIQQVSN